MKLEDWRALNYLTADMNAYLLFIACIFCIFKFNNLDRQFKYFVYYLTFSSILEILAKVFLKLEKPQDYFSFVNHLYVSSESIFIGLFIFSKLQSEKIKKFTIFCMSIMLIFELWAIFSNPLLDSRYSSALLASVYSVLILFALFDFSFHSFKKKFYQTPSILILLSFLIAYLIFVIIFWFLPSAIEYSRILANIMKIIQNIVGVLFYFVIIYAVWLSSSKKSISK